MFTTAPHYATKHGPGELAKIRAEQQAKTIEAVRAALARPVNHWAVGAYLDRPVMPTRHAKSLVVVRHCGRYGWWTERMPQACVPQWLGEAMIAWFGLKEDLPGRWISVPAEDEQ